MNYQYGDKVKLSRKGREAFGDHGIGTVGCSCSPWTTRFEDGWTNNLVEEYLTPVTTQDTMSLVDKMALVFKGEPEKSFIRAGVMETDETLTKEGTAVFLAWLLKKNGTDFKKEVVDPILAEEEGKE